MALVLVLATRWFDLGGGSMGASQNFDNGELKRAMRDAYAVLVQFVTGPEFTSLLAEMRDLSDIRREQFIRHILLNRAALEARGLVVPSDIIIQRSAFGDRRPTLFCVKKYLPKEFHTVWENVNLTFDAIYDDEFVSRDAESSWRAPIRPDIQSLFLAVGIPLESLPSALGVKRGMMAKSDDSFNTMLSTY